MKLTENMVKSTITDWIIMGEKGYSSLDAATNWIRLLDYVYMDDDIDMENGFFYNGGDGTLYFVDMENKKVYYSECFSSDGIDDQIKIDNEIYDDILKDKI